MGKGKRRREAAAMDVDSDSLAEEPLGAAVATATVTAPSVLPPALLARRGTRTLALTSRQVYQDLIFRIDGFLTPAECGSWIDWGEDIGFEHTFLAATRENAHRDNGRLQVHSPEVAAAVWERVRAFVPPQLPGGRAAAGCNPNIRLYRYTAGQRFGKHIDESVPDPSTGTISEFTLLIYLNGGSGSGGRGGGGGDEMALVGGETIFYKGSYGAKVAARVVPAAGAAVLHGHGARCLTHEGALVIAGTKYLLRTDVMYAQR